MGQNVGAMERDTLIGHGASALLRERLCDVSDAYQAVYCTNCGQMASIDVATKNIHCKNCGVEGQFGIVKIPYIFKLMVYLLMGAGLKLSLSFNTQK